MIALSYSKLNNFKQCPRKFRLQYLDKVEEFKYVESPAAARGTKLHAQLEDWVKAKIESKPSVKLSKECESAIPIVEKLVDQYENVYPEQKVSINLDHKEVSWFDRSTYYRGIIDLMVTDGDKAVVIDYKSGKVRDYDGFGGQLHLMAMIVFSIRPEINKVTAAYLFLDHKQTTTVEFTRDDMSALMKYYKKQFDLVNAETEFKPTVNRYCHWCTATNEQCEMKK
jgi:CRISPR/Cas system-associated exonuclease Cas4 (RecB family)